MKNLISSCWKLRILKSKLVNNLDFCLGLNKNLWNLTENRWNSRFYGQKWRQTVLFAVKFKNFKIESVQMKMIKKIQYFQDLNNFWGHSNGFRRFRHVRKQCRVLQWATDLHSTVQVGAHRRQRPVHQRQQGGLVQGEVHVCLKNLGKILKNVKEVGKIMKIKEIFKNIYKSKKNLKCRNTVVW